MTALYRIFKYIRDLFSLCARSQKEGYVLMCYVETNEISNALQSQTNSKLPSNPMFCITVFSIC